MAHSEAKPERTSPNPHYKRASCRGCDGRRLFKFLELGPTPLANSFLNGPEQFAAEQSYPLDVYFCEDCSLVQLLDVIDPELLFRDYIYVTGTSDTIAAHNRGYAETVADVLRLTPDELVVEVASNDGSLLKQFRDRGVRTLGIEPARNIARLARNDGIDTVNEFFTLEIATRVRDSHGPAKAMIGNNVFAHVDDARGFLSAGKSLAAPDGLIIIEVPYLGHLLDRLEFDTIYHEHLCYFSITALMHLYRSVGLSIIRLDPMPVHGGSIRIYAGHREKHPEHAQDVVAIGARERAQGLADPARYQRFADEVRATRQKLLETLHGIVRRGETVAGYGAPAKGNTLLNYCGISTDLLPYTVDKNPMKVGLYTPGMHIPVQAVAALLERQPDFLLILAWNFADEIIRQQREYQARGGRFIVPIPRPRIV